jgi:hypothetical protein
MGAEIFCDSADENPILADGVVIRTQKKMDFIPGAAKPGAIITSQGPASDNGDFHNGKKKAL